MIIKHGVWLYENKLKKGSSWSVIVADPVTHEPHKTTFPTQEKAKAFGMRAHSIVTIDKAQRSVVGDAMGHRTPYAGAVERYYKWLLQAGRTPEYAYINRNLLLALAENHSFEFCDEVSYDLLSKEHARRDPYADHGRKSISAITTFLRRINKKWKIAIDETALTYGKDGEISPPNDPTRVGAFTDAEVAAFLGRLHSLSHDVALSDFLRARWRALLVLCFFLLRYGMRPKHACAIKVECWHTESRQLRLPPPKKSNKQAPTVIPVDFVTARMLDWSCRGKAPQAYLFSPPPKGKSIALPRWAHFNISRFVKSTLRSLSISGSLYRMKHTALSYLCRRHGGDLKLVAEISGHRQVQSLWRYLQVVSDRRKVIADDYNAVDVSNGTAARYDGLLTTADDHVVLPAAGMSTAPAAGVPALDETTAADVDSDDSDLREAHPAA